MLDLQAIKTKLDTLVANGPNWDLAVSQSRINITVIDRSDPDGKSVTFDVVSDNPQKLQKLVKWHNDIINTLHDLLSLNAGDK